MSGDIEMRDLVGDGHIHQHIHLTKDSSTEHNDDEDVDKSSNGKRSGIHWITSAAFIVADIAGGGVVTMPKAVLNSGGYLPSFIIMLIVCAVFCYTGILLGENLMIMYRRWPSYKKEHCRKPFPEMAYRSFGNKARNFTSGTLHLMLYGVSIVYLLLSARIINDLVSSAFNLRFGECKMLILLSILLWPLVLCKSPQDFYGAVILAMLTTVFAVSLILFGIINDMPQCHKEANFPKFSTGKMMTSLGIFFFGFGGHGVFPTIQQDMRNPKQFSNSVILAFTLVCVLYLPLGFMAYSTYGDSLSDSVINSIQSPLIQQFANFFIACHCILTLTIVINPLSNELEHYLDVPHEFGVQRITVRTILLITIVFAALTVPSFGPILDLLGGTTVALTSAVFPCLFNLCLKANENASKHEIKSCAGLVRLVLRKTNKIRLIINLSIVFLAIVCGIVTSKSALEELANSSFSVPCYFPSYKPSTSAHMQCCGAFKNISVFGDDLLDACSKSH